MSNVTNKNDDQILGTEKVFNIQDEANKTAIRLILGNLKGLSIYEAERVLYEVGSTIKKKTVI